VDRLYFITGCTACGKGAVARELAGRIGGRIISADSMKVYRRMDIGTAKPSARHRREIHHYCIDLVEPSESFSVARYLAFADEAVATARAAGAIPLVVGGTGLYIKALSEGLFEAPVVDEAIREELKLRLARTGSAALHATLARADPAAAERIHPNDAKRIVRALEVYLSTGRPISQLQSQWDAGRERYDCVFMALRRDKADLHGRINRRVKRMIAAGLVDEVRSLISSTDGPAGPARPAGLAEQAAQAVGYGEIIAHLAGRCTLDSAVERIKINTRRLARKQRTWHRRRPEMHWFDLGPDDQPGQVADRIMERITFE